MKAGGGHPSRADPLRGAKTGRAEPGVSRTNSFARFQSVGLLSGCCHASIIIGRRQQCCFAGAADLKFLPWSLQARIRNFKSKAAPERFICWCPFCFPKFLLGDAATVQELRKTGH
jgi:hypothetical protein